MQLLDLGWVVPASFHQWTWDTWSRMFSSALLVKEQLIEVRTSSHAGVAHASTNGQDTSATCDITGESRHLMSDQRMEPWASRWGLPAEVVFFNMRMCRW